MHLLQRLVPPRRMRLLVTLRSPDFKPLRKRLPYWLQILSLTPLLIGALTFVALLVVPQMHEVYRSFVDTLDTQRALLGLLAVQFLGALLFCWNRDLNRMKIDQIYPNHADLVIDRQLFAVRHWKSLLCALLPAAGLTGGLYWAQVFAVDQIDLYSAVARTVRASELPTMPEQLAAMQTLPAGLWLGIAVTAASSLGLLALLWVFRNGHGLGRIVYSIAGLLTIFISLTPMINGGQTSIQAATGLGPLAVAGMIVVTVTCGLIILSRLSRRLGLPLISLVVMLILFFSFRTLVSNVGIDETANDQGVGEVQAQGQNKKSRITAEFDLWLKEREDRRAFDTKPYPAFIFAIQGGGIYAASASASYLATLQDHCPVATQHIFAVSAVSGGSMGTAVYQAMAAGQRQIKRSTPGCDVPITQPMLPRVTRVVEEDHLSPLLSFVISDQIRKLDLIALGDWLGLSDKIPDRADALEESFTLALDRDLAKHPVNDYFNAGEPNRLRQRYRNSWSPILAAPAVLLNATSVEAGHRVVFSPFALEEIGDGTLFAFSDIDQGRVLDETKLIEAAGVSSRIPGIVPPWTLLHEDPQADGPRRWNFVDGGYADGSGAATAFDMFRVLDQHIRDNNLNVDLRLVLLTDSVAAPRFEDIEGNFLGDAMVTISTLMQIRRLLSVRAVTQAKTEVQKLGPDRIFISHLEHKTFPLSLGWRIAPSTNAIVRLLIGRPDLYPASECSDLRRTRIPDARAGQSVRNVKIERAAETIRTNSCTMQRLIQLVAGIEQTADMRPAMSPGG